MSQSQDVSSPAAGAPVGSEADPIGVVADHPHDFDVQKELHRKIRNDPDYDDWEYGTEPLPHEAWVARRAAEGKPPAV
ncbi:hypothetical protein [Vulcanococcus limneticus]|uniref:hypothetical protein n=1 Tax=Vulcanococcus limneticus TaxID=2170428 RepID=UPI0012FFA3C3|nr:hypothetical protein [Vulcanococcus limneticus]MCP9790783.1 hypothetical protein [Vulcanococcus limneticus MW73D5]MCP9892874.1 hypothetical protein [Vulcanococcus limneticus Candia 3F8]MCP9896391.1 hypothetical protein [Vulcanococcus limneticus Candia 3B3]